MKKLIVILKDQLSFTLSSLRNADPANDTLLFCELVESSTAHHQKKIAFGLACMRHFARALEKQGFHVIYIPVTKIKKDSTLSQEIVSVYEKESYEQVVLTEPSEWNVLEEIKELQRNIPLAFLIDDRFLATKSEFHAPGVSSRSWWADWFVVLPRAPP